LWPACEQKRYDKKAGAGGCPVGSGCARAVWSGINAYRCPVRQSRLAEMAEKKKTSASKIVEKRMSKPPLSKSVKPSDQARSTGSSAFAAPASAPLKQNSQKQLAAFESAMRLFHARQLQQARDLFQQAVEGPERDVAQRARLHIAMCDRRLRQETPSLRSADDYYNYAIALINARKLAEAEQHLERALEIAPGSDHIHYALALAQALGGDLSNAHDNLRRAIEIEPRNRIIARQDADFAPLANQPPFDALLYPEKKNW
jgi:tetratricopeptide (TPR) repeat protein